MGKMFELLKEGLEEAIEWHRGNIKLITKLVYMVNKKTKKSKYESRPLTYEEHKKIDEFLRYFHNEGIKVFDLLRQCFGDHEEPVIRMAKAVNLMNCIHQYCETKSCSHMPRPLKYDSEEYQKWCSLYYHIGSWATEGWDKMRKKK